MCVGGIRRLCIDGLGISALKHLQDDVAGRPSTLSLWREKKKRKKKKK